VPAAATQQLKTTLQQYILAFLDNLSKEQQQTKPQSLKCAIMKLKNQMNI